MIEITWATRFTQVPVIQVLILSARVLKPTVIFLDNVYIVAQTKETRSRKLSFCKWILQNIRLAYLLLQWTNNLLKVENICFVSNDRKSSNVFVLTSAICRYILLTSFMYRRVFVTGVPHTGHPLGAISPFLKAEEKCWSKVRDSMVWSQSTIKTNLEWQKLIILILECFYLWFIPSNFWFKYLLFVQFATQIEENMVGPMGHNMATATAPSWL